MRSKLLWQSAAITTAFVLSLSPVAFANVSRGGGLGHIGGAGFGGGFSGHQAGGFGGGAHFGGFGGGSAFRGGSFGFAPRGGMRSMAGPAFRSPGMEHFSAPSIVGRPHSSIPSGGRAFSSSRGVVRGGLPARADGRESFLQKHATAQQSAMTPGGSAGRPGASHDTAAPRAARTTPMRPRGHGMLHSGIVSHATHRRGTAWHDWRDGHRHHRASAFFAFGFPFGFYDPWWPYWWAYYPAYGVQIQNLTSDLAQSFAYHGKTGALVADVLPGSPAEKAGLKQGDIIVSLDGKPVQSINELRNAVAAMHPGAKMNLEVFRDGGTKTFSVEVGAAETQRKSARAESGHESSPGLGMTVDTLTPEIARRLGLGDEHGVVVIDVQSGSLAERAGIRPRDVIVSVGDSPISNVQDLQPATKKLDLTHGIRMQIHSDTGRHFVFLKSTPPPA